MRGGGLVARPPNARSDGMWGLFADERAGDGEDLSLVQALIERSIRRIALQHGTDCTNVTRLNGEDRGSGQQKGGVLKFPAWPR